MAMAASLWPPTALPGAALPLSDPFSHYLGGSIREMGSGVGWNMLHYCPAMGV